MFSAAAQMLAVKPSILAVLAEEIGKSITAGDWSVDDPFNWHSLTRTWACATYQTNHAASASQHLEWMVLMMKSSKNGAKACSVCRA